MGRRPKRGEKEETLPKRGTERENFAKEGERKREPAPGLPRTMKINCISPLP
jgi:hypothetical protein